MSKILNKFLPGASVNVSRRQFLRTATALSAAGVAGAPFALNLATMASAAAQQAPGDYKAIVCIFLNGGNDQGNTVLATDTTSWNLYRTVRTTTDAASIALPAVGATGGVLPITPSTAQAGRTFALNPNMGPLKTLFDAGRAAVVANVGPLIAPMTLAQYKNGSVPRPPKLFSHNDQQSLWQSYGPEGARFGWGGRMGDLMMANNGNASFTAISASGNAVFLAGQSVNQYQISSGGAVAITGLTNLYGLPAGSNPLAGIVTADSANVFEKDHAAVVQRSISAQTLLASSMLPTTGVAAIPVYTNPNTRAAQTNSLAVQLQTVARMIGARNAIEIGTFTGYSAISVAGALVAGG
ncbi:MAG TPA: DUF1501 domain-containing protein, partial [Burkholderiaceae bacterium]